MPDSKKRLCPRRGCGKEFEDNGEIEKTPCCSFPIRAFDLRSEVEDALSFQREESEKAKAAEEAKKNPKKKGGTLSNLGGLI
jgi:hypothetical protein